MFHLMITYPHRSMNIHIIHRYLPVDFVDVFHKTDF